MKTIALLLALLLVACTSDEPSTEPAFADWPTADQCLAYPSTPGCYYRFNDMWHDTELPPFGSSWVRACTLCTKDGNVVCDGCCLTIKGYAAGADLVYCQAIGSANECTGGDGQLGGGEFPFGADYCDTITHTW